MDDINSISMLICLLLCTVTFKYKTIPGVKIQKILVEIHHIIYATVEKCTCQIPRILEYKQLNMNFIGRGTLHSKLALGFFSWSKSIYYCDVSLTNCTFIKLELRVQGTHF